MTTELKEPCKSWVEDWIDTPDEVVLVTFKLESKYGEDLFRYIVTPGKSEPTAIDDNGKECEDPVDYAIMRIWVVGLLGLHKEADLSDILAEADIDFLQSDKGRVCRNRLISIMLSLAHHHTGDFPLEDTRVGSLTIDSAIPITALTPADPDNISYLEMARLAMASVPEMIQENMDVSDEEFVRLRDKLQAHLNQKN